MILSQTVWKLEKTLIAFKLILRNLRREIYYCWIISNEKANYNLVFSLCNVEGHAQKHKSIKKIQFYRSIILLDHIGQRHVETKYFSFCFRTFIQKHKVKKSWFCFQLLVEGQETFRWRHHGLRKNFKWQFTRFLFKINWAKIRISIALHWPSSVSRG